MYPPISATGGSAAMKEITPFLDHGLTDALRDAEVPGYSEPQKPQD
jgi:hypothetical protein